jgi:predicted CXXCH cytochrome family protein
MTRTRPDELLHRPRYGALKGAALALALVLLPGTALFAAVPADLELSDEDRVCLDCHAKPGLRKTLDDGTTRSMYVKPRAFANSMHGEEGCEACHSDIDLDDHGEAQTAATGDPGRSPEDMMDTCRDCHRKSVRQYEDSVHLALVRHGSDKAPVCADCHDPHATLAVDEQTTEAENAVCASCHEPIANAYASSVHGRPGEDALACKDCHRAHDVKAASLGEHLKDQCVSCHENVAVSHADWLPNADRHLEAITCAACHTPGTTRRVNLRLFAGDVQHQVDTKVGVPQFVTMAASADPQGPGLDGRALWSLLQDFNRDGNGSAPRTMVRGRLEVQTGEEAHALAGRDEALSDCAVCHRKGAASFQRVSISMAGPDGRPLRHEASVGILNSIESIGSISGFYAIGSTRILWLDILLLLALGAGLFIPATHLTAKLILSRRRPGDGHDASASDPAAGNRAPRA